jgi:hypothetical protein
MMLSACQWRTPFLEESIMQPRSNQPGYLYSTLGWEAGGLESSQRPFFSLVLAFGRFLTARERNDIEQLPGGGAVAS